MYNALPVKTTGLFTFSWHFSVDLPCVKRVRIRNYSGPHFSWIFPHSDCISPYSVRENPGKMRTRITPNTDSFYVASVQELSC